MAIPWNIRGAFRSLSNTHDCFFLKHFQCIIDIWQDSKVFELVHASYQREVGLRLRGMFESWKCFRKFVAKLIAFFERGVRRQSTIACPTSYMLVIKSSRILKRRILRRSETIVWMCSVKMFFLKYLQYLQENTGGGVSFFNKVEDLQLATLSKKRLRQRCFPGDFAKILRNVILSTHSSDCF